MDQEISKQLNNILDSFDAKQKEAKRVEEQKKTEREIFLENFSKIIVDTITPAMEEVTKFLKTRGHDTDIKEFKEKINDKGITEPAKISFRIFPLGNRPRSLEPYDCPSVSFIVDSFQNRVNAHISTMMPGKGGHSGSEGLYSLNQITKEIVQKHIITTLSEAFK
jgi:hypothetical protein